MSSNLINLLMSKLQLMLTDVGEEEIYQLCEIIILQSQEIITQYDFVDEDKLSDILLETFLNLSGEEELPPKRKLLEIMVSLGMIDDKSRRRILDVQKILDEAGEDYEFCGEIASKRLGLVDPLMVDCSLMVQAADNMARAAAGQRRGVSDMSDKGREDAVKIGEEILKKLKALNSELEPEEWLGIDDQGHGLQQMQIASSMADMYDDCWSIYSFYARKSAKENAIVQSFMTMGKLAYLAKMAAIGLLDEKGKGEMARLLIEELSQMPEAWRDCHPDMREELMEDLGQGLEDMVELMNKANIKIPTNNQDLGLQQQNQQQNQQQTQQNRQQLQAHQFVSDYAKQNKEQKDNKQDQQKDNSKEQEANEKAQQKQLLKMFAALRRHSAKKAARDNAARAKEAAKMAEMKPNVDLNKEKSKGKDVDNMSLVSLSTDDQQQNFQRQHQIVHAIKSSGPSR